MPAAKCYVDDGASYSCEEGTTNIEAAFVLLSGMFHSDVVKAGPSPTPQSSGASTAGPLALNHVLPLPNPQTGPVLSLIASLQGGVRSVSVQVFTTGMVLVGHASLNGAWADGWQALSFPVGTLPRGLYFVRLSATDAAGGQVAARPVKLFRL